MTEEIDWSKVRTLEDVINVLSALEVPVPSSYDKRNMIVNYLKEKD